MKKKIIVLIALKALLIGIWAASGLEVLSRPAVAAPPEPPKAAVKQAPSKISNEREKGLLAAISRRQKELDEREDEIRVQEERLAQIRGDVEGRISELKKLNSSIERYVKKIEEMNEERIRKVVKIYESMSPEEAAPRLEKLEEEMAVKVLAAMNEKKAAKILGLVELKKSVKLSESLRVRYQ